MATPESTSSKMESHPTPEPPSSPQPHHKQQAHTLTQIKPAPAPSPKSKSKSPTTPHHSQRRISISTPPNPRSTNSSLKSPLLPFPPRRLSDATARPPRKSTEIIEPIDQSITRDEPRTDTIHPPVIKPSSLSVRKGRPHLFRVGILGPEGVGKRSLIRRICLNQFSESDTLDPTEKPLYRKSWTIDNHTFLLEFIPITVPTPPPPAPATSPGNASASSIPANHAGPELPAPESSSKPQTPSPRNEKAADGKKEEGISSLAISPSTRTQIESCEIIIILISPPTSTSHPPLSSPPTLTISQIQDLIHLVQTVKQEQWAAWTAGRNWPEEKSRFREGCKEWYSRGFRGIGILNSKSDLHAPIAKPIFNNERPGSAPRFGEVVLERLEERLERQRRETRRLEERAGAVRRLEGLFGGEVRIWECSSKSKERVWGVVDEIVRVGRREGGVRERVEEEVGRRREREGVRRRKSVEGGRRRGVERQRVVALWKKVRGLVSRGDLVREKVEVGLKEKVVVKDLKTGVKT